MKKLLTIFLSIISLTLIAQVPQGVGYQGVATDANGIELVNQSISIKASVLSGSANGTIEWEETHATTTDTFGLFTLTIGQGTNTTNGAQTSFADISWGSNTHFLKIEMDVTGGSNYSFMGTNQMMSVPYALYAESANINYDSISNLLSNDSTFITNVGGGMGGGGCNYDFPEGLDGDIIDFYIPTSSSTTYTVPSGKRLYITRINSTNGMLAIDGVGIFNTYVNSNYQNARSLNSTIIADENQIISNLPASFGELRFIGILVDANNNVQPITESSSTYTVPISSILVITYISRGTGSFELNGTGIMELVEDETEAFAVSGGSIIATNNGSFNGYLVDENYFAGCGGGGSSSSTSSLDSTTIANMIAASGGGSGCDFLYPDGKNNITPINHNLLTGDYTVPSGKSLYITGVYQYGPEDMLQISGVNIFKGYGLRNYYAVPISDHINQPILAQENDVISSSTTSQASFTGFLIDKNINIINFELQGTLTGGNVTYTVPNGKILVLLNLYSDGTPLYVDGYININGHYNHYATGNLNPGAKCLSTPIIFGENRILSAQSDGVVFNGYLVDENYFAGCGGGSSSSSTSSLDSTTIANMIAAAGGSSGGCDIEYPDGLDGEPITIDNLGSSPYVVPSGKNLYFQFFGYSASNELKINNILISEGYSNWNEARGSSPFIAKGGDVISASNSNSINGYLVDENYFAGCGGGGGSSSTSSLDSTTIANMIAGAGGGCDFGEIYNISIQMDANFNSLYYVEAPEDAFMLIRLQSGTSGSSRFKIYNDTTSTELLSFSNAASNSGVVDHLTIPIKSGQYWKAFGFGGGGIALLGIIPFDCNGGSSNSSSTTSNNSVGDFSYPDGKDNITPVIHDLGSSTYIVPTGKNLYITSYQGINSSDELQISLNTVFKGRGQYSNGQGAPVGLFELPLIASSAEIVSAPGKMNGFLVNESITPITFSLSGNYVNNITYTVPAGKILVLLNFYSAMNGGYGNLQADGMFQLYGIFNYFDNISGCSPACETTSIKNPMFFDENTIISTEGWGDFQVINGYLMDK